MSYATEKAKLGRTPCIVVEIDLDYCSLEYGTAPCTAAVGTTGDDKCFNTRKTCQDPTNYSPAAKTYRFSNIEILDPAAMSAGLPCMPFVDRVTTAPTKLDPGKTIGVRASITVSFKDGPYTDRYVDKYVADRAYDPETRSTFWPKLKARNPFYYGRALRVKTGYLVDGAYDDANFQTRHYVMDSIRGPDQSEMWTIVAKDALKLADNDKSQAPLPTHGFLSTDIGDVSGVTVTLTPTGIGSEYDTSGTIYVDKEAILFTRSGDDLYLVERGTDGTTAATHSANAPVQQCLRYEDQLPHEVVYDLLVTYAGIPSGYIDLAAWEEESVAWLGGHTLSRLITKPMGVKALLDELMQQGLCTIWWDEIQQKIPFMAVRPPYPLDVMALDETYNLLKGSISVIEAVDQRITQVWVFFGQVDFTIDNRDSNYTSRYIAEDVDAESADEYDGVGILKVYANWLQTGDTSQARLIAFRLLSRYRDNLTTVQFSLDAKDSDLWTGDSATLACRQLIDEAGVQTPVMVQVVQAQDMADGTRFNYQGMVSNFFGRYGYITEDTMVDYDDATDDERLVNGFITQDDGKMPDGSDGYEMV